MRTAASTGRRTGICASLAAVSLCLGLSACGSSQPSGTEADPAALAPASSPLYVSAAVNPQGALKQSAVADTRVFRIHQPFASLLRSLTASGPFGSHDYVHEIESWVGRNAGLFATAPSSLEGAAQAIAHNLGGAFSLEALLRETAAGVLGASGSATALVLDTRDLAAAQAFTAKLARKQGAHTVHHRGVAFHADAHGDAEGIVGKFAVFGNEAGLRAAIDAHLDGSSLLRPGEPYATLAAKGPSGALAGVYLNPTGGQARSLIRALPGEPKQARISVVPQSSSVAVDADLLSSPAAEARAAAAAAEAANLVASLPPNLSIALGVGEGGAHGAAYIGLLRSIVSVESRSLLASFGGPALNGLLTRLAAQERQLRGLFGGWTGPAALFARGVGLETQAAVVVEAPSKAAARNAVGKLGAMLAAAGAQVSHTSIPGTEAAISIRVPGLPIALDAGAGGGRLVIGLGPESVQTALSPGPPESQSSAYASATSLAGGKPVLLVRFPQLVSALESFGLNENQAFAPTISSLRAFDSLAGAAQPLGGGVTRLHAGLALANNARPRQE